jgi:exonuclease SbcC
MIGRYEAMKVQAEAADRDLKSFRKEYTGMTRQIEDAEKYRDAAEKLPKIEQERQSLEAKLRDLQVRGERLKERRRELSITEDRIKKLEGEIKTLDKEIEAAREAESVAAALTELEGDYESIIEKIAHLKARIERETELIDQIKGGLCPLLNERCRNMREGEGLDQYFKVQAGNDRGFLLRAEQQRKEIQLRVVEAKRAQDKISVLENTRLQRERCVQELEINMTALSRLAAEIKEITFDPETFSRILQDLREIEQRLEEAFQARVKVGAIESLKASLELLKAKGREKRTSLDALKKELEEMSHLSEKLLQVEGRLDELSDPRARGRILRKMLANETSIRESIASLGKERSEAEAVINEVGMRLKAFEGIDLELQHQRERKAASEKDFNLHIESRPIAASLPAQEIELKAIEKESEDITHRAYLVKKELDEAQSLYDIDRHQQVRQDYEVAITEVARLNSELSSAQHRGNGLVVRIEKLQESKQRLGSLNLDRERCDNLLSLSDFIRDVLKRSGPFITEAHLQSISIEANQLYRDITGNPMISLRWDSGYEVILEESGYERSFTNLSGGEQMAAALSVRLAMLKELSEMRVAFFDEPTANMDEERRRNLAHQIGRIRDFDQLFVISHDDAFEGAADQILFVSAQGDEA